jgi:hypothetical protein
MQTRVLVLRVLRDGRTSVVVRVLQSNAVLKCELTKCNTTKLDAGKFATIHVHALEFPIIRASIIPDDCASADCAGAEEHSECHADTGSEKLLRRMTTPPRKRMCFQ